MEAKIRKQIYLDFDQNQILKQSSTRLGVSEAEVIRRAIVAQATRLSVLQRNRKAWENEFQYIQSLIKQGAVHGKRIWTREELHER